jgi:hypothetical protein
LGKDIFEKIPKAILGSSSKKRPLRVQFYFNELLVGQNEGTRNACQPSDTGPLPMLNFD